LPRQDRLRHGAVRWLGLRVARNLVGKIDQPLPADLHCLLKGAIGKKLLRFVRE
jgi:hypothetical protein